MKQKRHSLKMSANYSASPISPASALFFLYKIKQTKTQYKKMLKSTNHFLNNVVPRCLIKKSAHFQ